MQKNTWLIELSTLAGRLSGRKRRRRRCPATVTAAQILQQRTLLTAPVYEPPSEICDAPDDSIGGGSGNDSVDATDGSDPVLPTVSISFIDGEMWEGKTANLTNNGRVQVSRMGSTDGDLSVSLTAQPGGDGTATAGSDYSNIPTSVTIPDGATSVEFDIVVLNDSRVEGEEFVRIAVDSSTSYYVGGGNAQSPIFDNDFWEWDAPSAVPGTPQFDAQGFYQDSVTWSSDGSQLEMNGQVRVSENSVSASLNGMFTEEDVWWGPTVSWITDTTYLEFDFHPITGKIFVRQAGSFGGVDRSDGPLKGGISWDYSIDTTDHHAVTVNLSAIKVVAGGEVAWSFSGGFEVNGPSDVVKGGVSGTYTTTQSWAKSLAKSFTTTLAVKQFETPNGDPGLVLVTP